MIEKLINEQDELKKKIWESRRSKAAIKEEIFQIKNQSRELEKRKDELNEEIRKVNLIIEEADDKWWDIQNQIKKMKEGY